MLIMTTQDDVQTVPFQLEGQFTRHGAANSHPVNQIKN